MLSRGEDIVPLVGARRRDRLDEALGALDLQLTADDLAAIEEAVPRRRGGRRRATTPAQMALLDSERSSDRRLMVDGGPHAPSAILEAAEDVLRRYGPAKATVVDVARALGVSHGSVYRHFPSKAALRDAVTERWLDRLSGPLEKVVDRQDAGAATDPALGPPAEPGQADDGAGGPAAVRDLPRHRQRLA